MATTFDVYPRTRSVPSFGDVLAQATPRILDYLASYGIKKCPSLRFDVKDDQNVSQRRSLDSGFRWNEEHYAWFFFDGIAGGTDVHCRRVSALNITCWEGEKAERPLARALASHIDACLEVGSWWYFRRSINQSAMINLGYGYLAGALAELTDGFIYSMDGAWDYDRFPCRADEFYAVYFRPDKALEPNKKEWAERCIEFMREEIAELE